MQRRTFLKGLGATLAIPQLESLQAAKSASHAAPLRMAFVYAPNGVNLKKWMPTGTGSNYRMAASMKPMEKLRDSFQIIGGLDHDKAKANGDGAEHRSA